jgi:type II secretory pathway component GspD/PulD (secretin)
MKNSLLLSFVVSLGFLNLATAQEPAAEENTPPPPPARTPDLPADLPAELPDLPAELPNLPAAIPDLPPDALPGGGGNVQPAPPAPAPPADLDPSGQPTSGSAFGPLESQQREMEEADEGYIIKDAALNDIFQFLAKAAGRQYFHNAKIAGSEYLVTGHLNDGNPLQQMEELAFQFGLSLHTKGNTIYALTQAQLIQLPSSEFQYQLRYLRPTDIEEIEKIIKPMLSPGTGIVNFEPKTNTIVIIDSTHRIEQVRQLLHGIDKPKGQIIVETKILRVNTSAAERTGINWSTSLGRAGVPVSVARDLNSVFGIDGAGGVGSNLVLAPVEINGVLRALAEGGLASQISNPTLITEDNEQATISIIDRVPIITTTTTAGGAGVAPTITEEVRYKIDTTDKSIDTDPDKHREIGISLVVTPTLLPDGTVRMKMRPRSAQIVESIESITGNFYPRVTESMIESWARVPDGHSLVIGGFYGETKTDGKTKVPVLGDVPVINFFFKSKESSKERASLVFVVTPKSYNPQLSAQNRSASSFVRSGSLLSCDSDWVDPHNPGPAHEPNMARAIRGLQPAEAPYYPRTAEQNALEQSLAPQRSNANPVRGRARKH